MIQERLQSCNLHDSDGSRCLVAHTGECPLCVMRRLLDFERQFSKTLQESLTKAAETLKEVREELAQVSRERNNQSCPSESRP